MLARIAPKRINERKRSRIINRARRIEPVVINIVVTRLRERRTTELGAGEKTRSKETNVWFVRFRRAAQSALAHTEGGCAHAALPTIGAHSPELSRCQWKNKRPLITGEANPRKRDGIRELVKTFHQRECHTFSPVSMRERIQLCTHVLAYYVYLALFTIKCYYANKNDSQ